MSFYEFFVNHLFSHIDLVMPCGNISTSPLHIEMIKKRKSILNSSVTGSLRKNKLCFIFISLYCLDMSVETGPIAGDNIAVVIDSGLALVDFLNYRLTAKKDLSDLLQSNGIEQEHELPGLVIKVYLLLTQKMNVDVFDPLTKKRSSSENDVTVVVENPSQL